MKEAYAVNCMIVTLLQELRRRPDAKRGLVVLRDGGGMGIAAVFATC